MTMPEHDAADVYAQMLAAAKHEQDSLAKLRAVIHAYCKLIGKRRSPVLTTQHEINSTAARRRRLPLMDEAAFIEWLARLIQQGVAEGLFRPLDAEMSARCLLGMLHTLVIFEVTIRDNEVSSDVADHVLQLFIDGVCVNSGLVGVSRNSPFWEDQRVPEGNYEEYLETP